GCDGLLAIALHLCGKTVEKSRPAAAGGPGPDRLGQSIDAREDGVLEIPVGEQVFAPEIGLRAQDVTAFLDAQHRRYGLEVVDLGQRSDVQTPGRLILAMTL